MKRIADSVGVLLARTLGALPPGTPRRLAGPLAALAATLCRRKCRGIAANLADAGTVDVATAGREYWRQTAMSLLEVLRSLSGAVDACSTGVEVEGIERLREAHAEGRGVLLVSAHSGNWELVPPVVARDGAPIAVVARRMSCPRVERLLVDHRERCGVRTLFRGEAGASVAACRWLARGGVLGCMMDRHSGGRRLEVPLLGRATRMPIGPAELAVRCGSPVVLGLARRGEDGQSTVRFSRVETRGASDALSMVQCIARDLDRALAEAPEQWLWILRRNPDWVGCYRLVDDSGEGTTVPLGDPATAPAREAGDARHAHSSG